MELFRLSGHSCVGKYLQYSRVILILECVAMCSCHAQQHAPPLSAYSANCQILPIYRKACKQLLRFCLMALIHTAWLMSR